MWILFQNLSFQSNIHILFSIILTKIIIKHVNHENEITFGLWLMLTFVHDDF